MDNHVVLTLPMRAGCKLGLHRLEQVVWDYAKFGDILILALIGWIGPRHPLTRIRVFS